VAGDTQMDTVDVVMVDRMMKDIHIDYSRTY